MYNKNRHKKIKPIKQTKGKDVFLCIFDHWALYAQTVFCLRAAAVILNMSRDVVLDDRMRQYPLVHGHPIAMTGSVTDMIVRLLQQENTSIDNQNQ